MTPIAAILALARPGADGLVVTIPPDWAQGRTSYGGLTTALALHAAKASEDALPPLRSVQVTFAGPLAGEVTIAARRLRRGRNAAFIETTVSSEAGIGLTATFVFMAAIESQVDHDTRAASPHHAPPPGATLFEGFPDHFTRNFQFHDVKHTGPAEWRRWVRLRDAAGLDPEIALIAIADALPPAALKLVGGRAPVSSMIWLINLLEPRPETRDGWWLLDAVTDRAAGGFSSQRMTIADADGRRVADAIQGVAVFA